MEEAIRLIKTMWTENRATFHGKYFHAEEAILEPKPVQKPHPPIMIGGSGEQLTLRAVARLGNACNIFGAPDIVKQKYEILRRHCEKEKRNYDEIERTNLTGIVIAKDEPALKVKRHKMKVPDPYRGFVVTVPQAIELIDRYKEAGVQMFICSFYRNDWESMELLAGEVMPYV